MLNFDYQNIAIATVIYFDIAIAIDIDIDIAFICLKFLTFPAPEWISF